MIREKTFIKAWGSNPWPDLDNNKHISFHKDEQKELDSLIAQIKEISEKWLFSKESTIAFDTQARLDVITTIKINSPDFQDYMIDKVIQYVGWLGWHEGIIQID